MTDSGYKGIFDEAQRKSKAVNYAEFFPTFHNHPELFHFIMAPEYQSGPDGGSLRLALELEPTVFSELFAKGPSLLGNGSKEIDGVESRHILIMTFLIWKLGKDWGHVTEIGGGYGNCLRLVNGIVSYRTWSIVDLDYILELQKWFISNSGIYERVNFIDSEDTELQSILWPNLVIGTHSLSEFSLEDFQKYFSTIIKGSDWFFYVSQSSSPSQELVDKKLAIIHEYFTLESMMEYEGGSSIMYLFRKKE